MNEQNREKTLGKKLVALLAATAVGLGLTMTGCAPDDYEAPEDPEEPALPGEPAPQPAPEQPPMPEPDPDVNDAE